MDIFNYTWNVATLGPDNGSQRNINILATNRVSSDEIFIANFKGSYARRDDMERALATGFIKVKNLSESHTKEYLEKVKIDFTETLKEPYDLLTPTVDKSSFDLFQDLVTKKLVFPKVHQDLYLIALLNEESGEVSKLFRKQIEKELPIDKEDLKLELGDVLWTLTCIAKLHGITLEQIIVSNILKLQERELL